MKIDSGGYGYSGELAMPFDEAMARTTAVLAKYGFGVQSEIKISEALKAKLGVDLPREVILGVCNPKLAHEAIQVEPDITLLLPCNITLKESGSGTRVAAANPGQLVGMAGNPELKSVASEADEQIRAALQEL